jgi:hypothetical protein
MAQKKQSSKKMAPSAIAAIGAGAIALAAGTYYFFGPEGQKHRGKFKGWMIRMKGDIVEKIENTKEISQTVYDQIIDSVAAKYLKDTSINAADVKLLVARLKRDWHAISKNRAPKKKVAVKSVAKKMPAKKGSKKAVAKK